MTPRPHHRPQAFAASAAAFWRDEDGVCDILVVAERENGSGVRLEVQRAAEFNDQDRELGEDTYCLCDERGATHYGGVTRWFEDGDVLVVELDEDAARDLEVHSYRVRVKPEHLKVVRRGLSQLVGASSVS